jgi:hypothetical protein
LASGLPGPLCAAVSRPPQTVGKTKAALSRPAPRFDLWHRAGRPEASSGLEGGVVCLRKFYVPRGIHVATSRHRNHLHDNAPAPWILCGRNDSRPLEWSRCGIVYAASARCVCVSEIASERLIRTYAVSPPTLQSISTSQPKWPRAKVQNRMVASTSEQTVTRESATQTPARRRSRRVVGKWLTLVAGG